MNTIKQIHSPNFSSRRGLEVNCVVFHATGHNILSPTISLMSDPNSKVSSHFIIPRNIEEGIIQLVDLDQKAWHAGRAEMAKKRDVNLFSVAIQLVGTKDSGFTDWQYEASAIICDHLLSRFPSISMNRIVGHDMISERPNGPGLKWRWDRFFDTLVRKMYNLDIERT